MQTSSEDEKMNIGLETLQGLFVTWTQAIALQQAASQETPDPNQPADSQQPPNPTQSADPQQPPYADGYMLSSCSEELTQASSLNTQDPCACADAAH